MHSAAAVVAEDALKLILDAGDKMGESLATMVIEDCQDMPVRHEGWNEIGPEDGLHESCVGDSERKMKKNFRERLSHKAPSRTALMVAAEAHAHARTKRRDMQRQSEKFANVLKIIGEHMPPPFLTLCVAHNGKKIHSLGTSGKTHAAMNFLYWLRFNNKSPVRS